MNRTEEILQFIPDKREDKNTTSLKFKTDLINYFDKLSLKNCLEVGTYIGYSTRILSFLFDEVTTIDSNENYLVNARELNFDRDNITYLQLDVYNSDWGLNGEFTTSFIDCVHTYDAVQHDIKKSLEYGVTYLVFDDYGIDANMKRSIDDFIKTDENFEVTFVGEPEGNSPRVGNVLQAW
ncbi:MAG: hypothetical protein ACXACA_05990, partial [Candidatus Ranarchaeia archaeon]